MPRILQEIAEAAVFFTFNVESSGSVQAESFFSACDVALNPLKLSTVTLAIV